jgi:periplasmic divalent cation tolerance protein
MIVIVTTLPDAAVATALGEQLVTRKLAACVSVVPIASSLYIWQDKLECSSEVYLIAKTLQEQKERCVGCIKELHPYEVPFLIVLPVESYSQSYDAWMKTQLL